MRADIVPLRDHAGFALIPQDAQRSGSKRKKLAVRGRQTQPAGCQHAQDVAVRKQGDVSGSCQRARDHQVCPCGHLFDGLAPEPARSRWSSRALLSGSRRWCVLRKGRSPIRAGWARFGPHRHSPPAGRFRAHAAEDWSVPARKSARPGCAPYRRRGLRRRRSEGDPCGRCAAPRETTRSHRGASTRDSDGMDLKA